MDNTLTSDESDSDSAPTRRVTRKQTIPISYNLISDSEDDEASSVDIRKGQKNQSLGEISLLTSDEDVPKSSKVEKKNSRKRNNWSKPKAAFQTIDILTSDDEQEPSSKPTVASRKRKLKSSNDNSKEVVTKKPRTVRKTQQEPTDNDKSTDNINLFWEVHDVLAEKSRIDIDIARNLVKLWDDGNTIPFIARYRKHMIQNMSPEELRTVKENYDSACSLKKRICTVTKTVAQLGKLNDKLQTSICSARTMEEVEHLYAPFKPEPKTSLVEKARKCGLEEPALNLLYSRCKVCTSDYIDSKNKDLETKEAVEIGIIHIMAAEMASDLELITFLRDLRTKTPFKLKTAKIQHRKERQTLAKRIGSTKVSASEETKFQLYFEFSQFVNSLKSHQVLAINRGESLKILKVNVIIPESFERQVHQFCTKKWSTRTACDTSREDLVNLAIEDMYQRIISPLVCRETRAELKLKAEKESCCVFSDNLKHLLLTPPTKGKPILAIDPGFSHGCKLAVISATGSLLEHNVIYPHNKSGFEGKQIIKNMLLKYRCNLIALGNRTACRQTEEWLVSLITSNYFAPLDIQYAIVNEDGASIYSCSQEAKKEFGDLDPNIISAVSLARRVQDPLAELVKVEPRHLGIGMYQHDMRKKQLEEALNDVISECVSFVGVDLNTASQCLLRRVAGLSDNKATLIIDYRERNGPFTYRKELLNVFGIGERTFEQCAGFLRVGPTDPNDTEFYKRKSTTPLDATIIHPESYPIVQSLLGKMKLNERDVGTDCFIKQFQTKCQNMDVEQLAETYKTDKSTIQLIFDALTKTLNHDLRTENSDKTPLFKKGMNSMADLKKGTVLTGRVNNVTTFGAFVDVGVERAGLIHVKFMNGSTLHVGNVVETKVTDVDLVKQRLQLQLVRKM